MNGIDLIAAERVRQIKDEGWTAEHDDENHAGKLAAAAACYAINASGSLRNLDPSWHSNRPLYFWPWEDKWWKPKDPLRDLVRAGALIAAEIDRLQRQS